MRVGVEGVWEMGLGSQGVRVAFGLLSIDLFVTELQASSVRGGKKKWRLSHQQ